MTTLQVAWFFLMGTLLTVYAILDGFDLGVGIWHPLVKGDKERRIMLNAIGPVWDGNEVWLVTGGAVLFAAFPPVYATVFSGFYLAVMLIVFALILRAVSLEFRSKSDSPRWRKGWDAAFAIGSFIPALLFPVAIGNLLRGLPLDAAGNYAGGFFGLLSPYALLIGLTGLAMFATHGAIYIALKTEGRLRQDALKRAKLAWAAWVVLFILSGILTIFSHPERGTNFLAHPSLWIVIFFAIAALAITGYTLRLEYEGWAFIGSSLTIVGHMGIVAATLFPSLVPAIGKSGGGLTLANSSSSELTLKTMLVIAMIGIPIVVAYTLWIYRTFEGKVQEEHLSY